MQLVTYKELRLLFNIPFSRQHILRLQAAGKFPLHRKIGNQNFWTADEIREWIEQLRRPAPTLEGG